MGLIGRMKNGADGRTESPLQRRIEKQTRGSEYLKGYSIVLEIRGSEREVREGGWEELRNVCLNGEFGVDWSGVRGRDGDGWIMGEGFERGGRSKINGLWEGNKKWRIEGRIDKTLVFVGGMEEDTWRRLPGVMGVDIGVVRNW
jgi:hypothetical protein